MEIMNVKEVAEYLSCSESKIRNMTRDKEILVLEVNKSVRQPAPASRDAGAVFITLT